MPELMDAAEMKKMLARAKTAEVHCAAALGKPEALLVLDVRKPTSTVIQSIKKEGGSKIFVGTVSMEGGVYIFTFEAKAPSGFDRALMRSIKATSGLSVKVEIREA